MTLSSELVEKLMRRLIICEGVHADVDSLMQVQAERQRDTSPCGGSPKRESVKPYRSCFTQQEQDTETVSRQAVEAECFEQLRLRRRLLARAHQHAQKIASRATAIRDAKINGDSCSTASTVDTLGECFSRKATSTSLGLAGQ
uniref:Uncharacterized protein n=1 Tax=Noctiluca scintillans TaxID=2966 RepID=A0A7S1FDH6_NOCSC